MAREPAPDAFVFDRAGQRFVEHRVAFDEYQLVRQFVEDQPRHFGFALAQEGVEHRVAEVAQGRIRRHAADVGVEALPLEFVGQGLGLPAVVEAAVAHAADDQHAPVFGGERKLAGREHVPDDVGPAKIGERAVTSVIGQAKFAAREVADFLDPAQPLAGFRRRGGVGQHLVDRPRRVHHLEVAADRLAVVGEVGAAGQREREKEDEDVPKHERNSRF